jgi:hypothetical protein
MPEIMQQSPATENRLTLCEIQDDEHNLETKNNKKSGQTYTTNTTKTISHSMQHQPLKQQSAPHANSQDTAPASCC